MQIILYKLFFAIKDNIMQLLIFDRLYSIKHIIIIIYTFLKNMKYLKLYIRILKKLLLSKSKGLLS